MNERGAKKIRDVDTRSPLWKRIGIQIILVVTSPIWVALLLIMLALLPVYGLFRWLQGCWLRYHFERASGRAGKRILFVYSDSPNWKNYIETNILPKIAPHAVIMNWSQRGQWQEKAPLEAKIFRHWAGDREFNPIAIVVPKLGRVSTIRFWQAFKDAKHGKTKTIHAKEEELFGVVRSLSHA